MNDARTPRIVAAAALLLAAALFAIGISIERTRMEPRTQTQVTSPHEEAGGKTTGGATEQTGEAGQEGTGTGEAVGHRAKSDAVLLGIDLESTPFVVVAVLASLALAVALIALRSRGVFVAVIIVALLFAVADVREVLHQLDENHSGLAVTAATVAILHVVAGVAALAAWGGPRPIWASRAE